VTDRDPRGSLEAHGVPASYGNPASTGIGEVEKDGGVVVVRRIHVAYRLKRVGQEDRRTVERVNGFHVDHCPVARSIHGSIDITTDVEYVQ